MKPPEFAVGVSNERIPSRERHPSGRKRLTPPLARFILGSIVALGTALALGWALAVPMLQTSDESAHIDYAFSILTAQRISISHGQPISTDVHPYTRYLEMVTGFRGMRYGSYGRVPKGYGTRAFFARVDAGAPRVKPASIDTRALPLYARAYPFGFYALEAAVMALTGRIFHDSLVAEFFAARFFCVALLIPTLLCTYGIFRYAALSRALSLTLTASVAFFPLTSSIFSCVQPDDLVAALAVAIVLATLHLRDRPSLRTAAFVGALLAALALTKYHDAIVLMAIVAVMASTRRLVRTKLPYVIAPALVAFATAAFVMGTSNAQRFLCADVGAGVRVALSESPQRFLTYVLNGSVQFLASTFAGGWSFLQYWDSIGWVVHQIIFGSQSVTNGIMAFLSFFTIVTLLCMLMRAVVVSGRLVTVARKRTIACAVRVASNDVVLNLYIAYLVFLIAANAYSGNRLEQGRYWLPLIFCALLCATRYVPHFIGRRFERSLSGIVASALALYSIAAVLPALATVHRSYYVSRPLVEYRETWARFDDSTTGRFTAGHIRRGSTIGISGLAIDGASETVARGASLLIDGNSRVALRYGSPRPDLVCMLNDVSLSRSGFTGALETAGLAPGHHTLELQVSEEEFAAPVRTARRIAFVIDSATER